MTSKRFWASMGAVAALAFISQPAKAVETTTNWAVGLNFFFSNDDAPGRISQDTLPLTLGATNQSPISKLKPPPPPSKAQTSDAGYPLVDAFVGNGVQKFYSVQGTPDVNGAKVFLVQVKAEEAGAQVSIGLDCTSLDPNVTLTVIHARTKRKAQVSKGSCSTLENFLDVASANTAEEVFVVGAKAGGGFVGKTSDGGILGVIATDQVDSGAEGVALKIGGQTVPVAADGTFQASGVTGLQQVVVSRKGHLTRKIEVNLADGAEPVVLPKLAGGDADYNNTIDLSDFGLLKQQFDSADTTCYTNPDLNVFCADFDGDKDVDLDDFSILKRNFDQTGDSPN